MRDLYLIEKELVSGGICCCGLEKEILSGDDNWDVVSSWHCHVRCVGNNYYSYVEDISVKSCKHKKVLSNVCMVRT